MSDSPTDSTDSSLSQKSQQDVSKKNQRSKTLPQPPKSAKGSELSAHEVSEALGGGDFGRMVEDNAKLIVAVCVVALLAALGYVGFQFIQRRQEKSAAEAYFPIEQRFAKLKEGFEQAKAQALNPTPPPSAAKKDDKTPAPPKAATGKLDEDYGSVIGDLDKFVHDHAGTAAGAQAALDLADTYLQYKQPDKAIEIAKIPAEQLSSQNILSSLARVLWGTALADKGDCQGAVTVWQVVLDSKQAQFLSADTSLRSGVCYEKMGQLDKAAEMYRKTSVDAPEGTASQTAKGFLRSLELKGKTSNPSPKSAKSGSRKGGRA